jgi:muconolactone D-isomerase
MDFLVKATPSGRLLDLSADDLDELMAGEREVASALIARGTITWMWRLPDTTTSISIWDAESAEALDAALRTLPIHPYNDIEVTALAAHPAFPTPLRATPPTGPAR